MLSRLATDRAARHLIPAVVMALGVEIGIRTFSLRRLASLTGVSVDLAPALLTVNGDVRFDGIEGARIRAVQIIMHRWPWGARGPCLRQALVAGWMLRHRQPRLVLGAGRDARGTVAHAWLLVDGLALDPDASRWTPLLAPGAA